MSDTELTLSERLQHAVFGATADDMTEPGSAERHRHNQRLDVMREAAMRLAEFERMVDVRLDAEMRAIRRWQEMTGKALTWPDHAELCVWLMQQLDEREPAPPIQPILAKDRADGDRA